MKKEYKVGILGFGFMGKAHTFGYQTMQLYYDNLPFLMKLGAVATRDEERAKRFSRSLALNTMRPMKIGSSMTPTSTSSISARQTTCIRMRSSSASRPAKMFIARSPWF